MTKKYYVELYEDCEIHYKGIYQAPSRDDMLASAAGYDEPTTEEEFTDYDKAYEYYWSNLKDVENRPAWLVDTFSSKVWNFDYIDFFSKEYDDDGNEVDFEFIDSGVSATPIAPAYKD